MKHGEKFLKKRGKKPTKLLWSIVLIVSLIAGLTLILKKKDYTDIKSQYKMLEAKQFVFVQDPESVKVYGESYGINLDLKNKNFFGEMKAVKNKKSYGWYESGDVLFKNILERRLSSIILNLKISKKEINQNDFKVIKEVYPLLDKKALKEKYPPDFEQYYLKHKLTKVKIVYNKQYLPIRIEGYYEEKKEMKWHVMRKISYPYKNQKAFDKALNEEIKLIKEEEEMNKKQRRIEEGD